MSFDRIRFAKTSPALILSAVFALVLILGGEPLGARPGDRDASH